MILPHGIAIRMGKDKKRRYIIIDVTNDPDFLEALQKEADRDGRDLSNYMKHLARTHQDRQKGKKK